jgi:hypothetical protein
VKLLLKIKYDTKYTKQTIEKLKFRMQQLPIVFTKRKKKYKTKVLAIMAPIGFSFYCTLKLLFSRVRVLPQV